MPAKGDDDIDTPSDPDQRPGPRLPRVVTGDPEDRFRRLFETLPVGVFQTRPDGTILEANPALAELLGYPDPDALRGLDATALYADPDARADWRETLGDVGVVDGVPLELERRDGQTVWVEMTARALKDDDGETFYEGVVVDVTDRRETERALEAAAARFRSLLESAPDAMIMVDQDGQIRIANSEAESLFGCTRDELTGMQVEALIPERFRDDHVAQRERYMKDPQRRPMGAGLDLYALTSDGTEVPVEISLSPAQVPGDELAIAAIRDISETQRIEETLRVLRTMPVATEDAETPDEAVRAALEIVCQATGWPRGEAWEPGPDGALILAHAHHGGGDQLDRFVEASRERGFEPGDGVPGRTWVRGGPVWVDALDQVEGALASLASEHHGFGSVVGIPVHADEDQVVAVLVFFLPERQEADERFVEVLDAVAAQLGTVVQRKRVEQQLRQRTSELEVANEELKGFTRSVAHDLQSPLRTIEGFGHILLEKHGDDLDEQARFLVERMRNAAREMTSLVESLSMLSRITRQRMDPQPVDLSSLARSIVESLLEQHPERSVEVDIQSALVVEGDHGLLKILLENLLSNAWKFTRGVDEPRIELGMTRGEGHEVFYVRDNGAGFPEEKAQEIFEPFKRAHGDAFEGTGVGLATVHRIVRRHGGEIEATSSDDEGATFRFTLEGEPLEDDA